MLVPENTFSLSKDLHLHKIASDFVYFNIVFAYTFFVEVYFQDLAKSLHVFIYDSHNWFICQSKICISDKLLVIIYVFLFRPIFQI